jgi:hypothetical protein
MELSMRAVAKRRLSAVLIALCAGVYVYAQGLDMVMRVGGDIISTDPAFGTYTIETSSGPRMTVLPLPGRQGGGAALEFKVGESVVVSFRQSSAQGRVTGGGRRPATVDTLSVIAAPLGFCSCSKPSDKGCDGTCAGSGPGSCKVLQGIVYPSVCGVEQLRTALP